MGQRKKNRICGLGQAVFVLAGTNAGEKLILCIA
jgi:coenzyme F420-reducing hydrogenase alpha subunit